MVADDFSRRDATPSMPFPCRVLRRVSGCVEESHPSTVALPAALACRLGLMGFPVIRRLHVVARGVSLARLLPSASVPGGLLNRRFNTRYLSVPLLRFRLHPRRVLTVASQTRGLPDPDCVP